MPSLWFRPAGSWKSPWMWLFRTTMLLPDSWRPSPSPEMSQRTIDADLTLWRTPDPDALPLGVDPALQRNVESARSSRPDVSLWTRTIPHQPYPPSTIEFR